MELIAQTLRPSCNFDKIIFTLHALKDDGARLSTTDASRPDRVALVQAVEGVHQVVGDTRARSSQRVTESC